MLGGALAGAGAVTALGVERAVGTAPEVGSPRPGPGAVPLADSVIPFHGPHQAGIATPAQAHATLVALDLGPATDAPALRRMMRLLTDDAARLTQGEAALADTEPELAAVPAALTVTFGFGPELVRRAVPDGVVRPTWVRPLPAFAVDRLEDAWSGGDLLLQVGAEDPLTVAHALRMLLKDARAFATVRWSQRGFRRAHGSEPAGTTMRNLFGQVDGTANPVPGTPDFDEVVWARDGWLAGGTGMVVRRIAMDLDGWDRLDRGGREMAVGRRLADGAPLTGARERDEPDLDATGPLGLPVIPEHAHLRRARSADRRERIFRRAYNYDDAPPGGTVSGSGQLFVAFQADVDAQLVPIQRRLAELDLLNQWTTPVGSAVFAVPPGCAPGGYVGETLLG
nr:Dyp-type peroxidase [Cellulomonas sp. APG4]